MPAACLAFHAASERTVNLHLSHPPRKRSIHATFITMPTYIDPATLEGQPLILKAMAPDDYGVRVLDRVAGRITLKPVSGRRVVWFWTVTGPYIPEHLRPSNGDADSIEEAKAAFRTKFDAWLAWAKDLHHPVVWHQGVGRVG